MEKIILSGMPEPMLQPLYARAKESQTHGTIRDDTAVRLVQQTQYFLSDTPHHGPPTLFFIFYIIHSKSRARCHFRTGPCSISNS